MEQRQESGKILWIGWGDLARKSREALSTVRESGYEIFALDVTEDPSGLQATEPDRLFLRTQRSHHAELTSLAKRDGFDLVYVANFGHQHISSALEFQHYTPHIVIAKPLDTCLAYLLNILKDQPNYIHLLERVFVHDHYLNKPGVSFLCERMPELHSEHNFLDSVKLFLVERHTIEEKEPRRRKALECGMLFDLAVHLISVLQAIIPKKMAWHNGQGGYARKGRRIEVTACAVAKDAGSILTKSTVMPGREAETFGVIELKVTEQVVHESGEEFERDFPVLLVVGKGVPAEQGVERDLKTVLLSFKDGAEVALDLDTYALRGLEDRELDDAGYHDIDFQQRGINLPLIVAAKGGLSTLVEHNPFQQYANALESVRILSEALSAARQKPTGYRAVYTTCSQLLNTLLRQDRRFSDWNLPDYFGNLLIGTPPEDAIL